MKEKEYFWVSLERYVRKTIERSHLPRNWPLLGIGLALVVLGSSAIGANSSVVGLMSVEAVIESAAKLGDYETARRLYENCAQPRCQEVADLVYPEKRLERKIEELEAKLLDYPGSRPIYLALTELYGQLGNKEKSDEYREKARVLDPNAEI